MKAEELTEEQRKEANLYARWMNSDERKKLEKFAGRPIEEVPEEYREKVARLREFGLGVKEKTTYEQVIEFLETHNGKMMRCAIKKNGKRLTADEMTTEEKEERNLHQRWMCSDERKKLEEFAGQPIEEVPEEYREKIERLREFGLGVKEKTTYKQVIEFLRTHNGKIMRSEIWKNGKRLTVDKITTEEKEERNLYQRWMCSDERKKLEEFAGRPIEEVPEEYREKIARLRGLGLGVSKSRLQQAKQRRDAARSIDDAAKELEQQVEGELKKRGETYEEQ